MKLAFLVASACAGVFFLLPAKAQQTNIANNGTSGASVSATVTVPTGAVSVTVEPMDADWPDPDDSLGSPTTQPIPPGLPPGSSYTANATIRCRKIYLNNWEAIHDGRYYTQVDGSGETTAEVYLRITFTFADKSTLTYETDPEPVNCGARL